MDERLRGSRVRDLLPGNRFLAALATGSLFGCMMGERNRWRAATAFRSCWCLVKWGLVLLALCAVLVGGYVWHCVDEELRAQIESVLARHYTGLSVSVRSARLLDLEGIEIRGLSIRDRSGRSPGHPLVYCDQLRIDCEPTIQGLLAGDFNARKLTVRKAVIRAVRGADGKWNLARLFPFPRVGTKSPPTTIDNATIEIVDSFGGSTRKQTLRNIQLRLRSLPRADARTTSKFYSPHPALSLATAAARGGGEEKRCEVNLASVSIARSGQGAVAPGLQPVEINGTIQGDHFRQAGISAVVDPGAGQWFVRATVNQLAIGPEMRRSLPASLASRLEPLAALRATGTFAFRLQGQLRSAAPIQYRMTGQIRDGRWRDPRLAFPITDLHAHVSADNRMLMIENATAQYGAATVQMSYWRDGPLPTSPALVSGSVQRLRVDQKLADLLPARQRADWGKYQPTGLLSADFRFRFDGRQWHPELVDVTCLDLSLRFFKFPYPLHGGTGTVSLKNDVLQLRDFRALAGETPIAVEATIRHPGPEWSGFVTLESKGLLPLDRPLIEASPPQAQRIVRDFHPDGWLGFTARYWRQPGQPLPIHQRLEIKLHDCRVRHVKFPYPLDQVRGNLSMQDGHWTFSQLTGSNDSARVHCGGQWSPAVSGGQLKLQFQADHVPLEDELRDALQPGPRQFWEGMRLRGTLDHLEANLVYSKLTGRTSIKVTLEQPIAPQGDPRGSISIRPRWFPYRVDRLRGVVTIHDGNVPLIHVRGDHGTIPISAEGHASVAPDGAWSLSFDRLIAERVRIDGDLLQAVPLSLRQAVTSLNLTGPISLDGAIGFAGSHLPNIPVATTWNMLLQVAEGSLDCGIALQHIRGDVKLIGANDRQGLRSHGTLNLDSLMYRGVQLTRVRGPLWFNQQRLLLGAWVPNGPDGSAPRMQASVLGGTIEGDASIWLKENGRFDLMAVLLDANLADLVRDISEKPVRVRGRAHAVLRLAGNGEGTHTLNGNGQVALREADIYELPLIVALLNVLRAGTPDRTAFTTSDIKFRVQGENIYLDKIDLSGDVISLKGKGDMDLNGNINLDFYSLLGRERDYLPAVFQVLGEASRRFLQIHVSGTLDYPRVRQEVLPFLNETLQQLFPETAASPGGGATGSGKVR